MKKENFQLIDTRAVIVKMIMKEPFFTVHIFDVLYDIFDMDELENFKINEKIINEMYSELIND